MIDSNAKISFLKWGLRPIEECVNWWYIAVAHNSTIGFGVMAHQYSAVMVIQS